MIDDFRPMRPPKPTETPTPTPSQPTAAPVEPFITPEQARQHDLAAPAIAATDGNIPSESDSQPPKNPRGTGHHWFNLPWPPKKQEILLASAVLVLAIFGVTGFLVFKKSPEPAPVVAAKPVKVAPPKPTTVASILSGLQVDPSLNQRPVVGVMIENSKAARPQAGLSEAGVVFEAIAEGGITRFLALFQDKQPSNIGPVRSARPYYVQWNEGFRAAYAHVGGSPEALANISDWGVQDLNQFYNAGVFRRDSGRSAPHNVYSNVADLAKLAGEKGYKSEFTGFARKEALAAKQPTATAIDFAISSSLYNVHYDYNAATNTYNRSEGGEAHLDSNTGAQLSPNVVIGMVVPLTYAGKTSQGGSYSNYAVVGSGVAHVFQDGTVTQVNWQKPSNTEQITFTDQAGKVVPINPGQTWITVLSDSSKVTYQ